MRAIRTLIFCGLLLAALGLSFVPQSKRLRPLDFASFEADLARLQPAEVRRIEALVVGSNIPQLQLRMSQHQLSSEQLTLFFLERIRRFDSRLRSYIELNPLALEEAREADRLRSSGQLLGPMHGIPISLKDNIGTALPLHTSGGAEILLDYAPIQDAPLVSGLRESGVVILGKSSLSELAGVVSGKTPGSNAVSGAGLNPYREGLPVLGSSSGSAIGTSAYLCCASVGTETSGSIVAPASANGVVGLKPSWGVVDGSGLIPLIVSQDCAGPLTRNVTDAAVLLGCLDRRHRNYTQNLRVQALRGVRVGLLPEATRPGLRSQRIRAGLDRAGAVCLSVEDSLQGFSLLDTLALAVNYELVPYLQDCGASVRSLEQLRRYNLARPRRRIPFGQDFLDFCLKRTDSILGRARVTPAQAPEYYKKLCRQGQERAAQSLMQVFSGQKLEVLVSHTHLASEYYATAGFPAIAIPLGRDGSGLPIAVTLIGKPGQDASLLAFAYALEQATLLRVEPELFEP